MHATLRRALACLPGTQGDKAALMGVSTQTLAHWIAGEPASAIPGRAGRARYRKLRASDVARAVELLLEHTAAVEETRGAIERTFDES